MIGLKHSATLLGLSLAAFACSDPAETTDDGGSSGETSGSTSAPTSATGSGTTADPSASSSGAADSSTGSDPGEVDPAEFFTAITGLWVAPVTSWTSAGSFPTMNMDVRAASDAVLFSRVDLDAENSLRFAFQLEEHDGEVQLVYRNGGDFLGVPRDTRTVLHERTGDMWRFCGMGTAGCDYVDARFTFEGPDALELDVDVLGMRHIEWSATRREPRALGGAFPDPPTEPSDAPFPPMPALEIEASWSDPLEAPADVWVVLSTTDCGVNPVANCVPSRYMKAEADAGATGVTLNIEQIHPGEYRANAVLDRNQNLSGGILLPDAGDAVAIPLDTLASVPDEGTGTVQLGLWMDL